jgi:hypothetical protein
MVPSRDRFTTVPAKVDAGSIALRCVPNAFQMSSPKVASRCEIAVKQRNAATADGKGLTKSMPMGPAGSITVCARFACTARVWLRTPVVSTVVFAIV